MYSNNINPLLLPVRLGAVVRAKTSHPALDRDFQDFFSATKIKVILVVTQIPFIQ